MPLLKGLGGGEGFAVGRVYLLKSASALPNVTALAQAPAAELARLEQAVQTAGERLQAQCTRALRTIGQSAADIFQIHQLMLADNDFLTYIKSQITAQRLSAEAAVAQAGAYFVGLFAALEDGVMRQRAADVQDVVQHLLSALAARLDTPPDTGGEGVIVAAEELLPSHTMLFDKDRALAFISHRGGPGSHAFILAHSLGIPAVVLPHGFQQLQSGDTVIVDGKAGEVVLTPSAAEISAYEAKRTAWLAGRAQYSRSARLPAFTADGTRVQVTANLNTPEEAADALKKGAEGVGLFRSEYLFMSGSALGEDLQYEAYARLLSSMAPRRVVVRTLDAGSDKPLPGFPAGAEANPSLGLRGIRLCLAHPNIFCAQLRALLRAGVHGNLAILFPMVTCAEELTAALSLLKEQHQALTTAGVPCASGYQVGVMIETPAAAIIADKLAPLVQFFSIGTNDLTQYAFAADRTNAAVAHLYQPGSVAVLRLVRQVVRTAQQYGLQVSVCGESAANTALLPHYLAAGINELSMAADAIGSAKAMVRALSLPACRAQSAALLGE